MNGVRIGVFHTTPILPTTPIVLHCQSHPLRVPTSSPHSGLVQQVGPREPLLGVGVGDLLPLYDMTTRDDIPMLPGHFRIVRRRFISAWIVCLASVILGVLLGQQVGLRASLLLVGVFVLAFVVGVVAFFTSKRAECPRCRARMQQGWDERSHRSTGVFSCPTCHSQWRTDAVYSFGGE